MKIIFTGAQGTGKTSVMDVLHSSLYKIRGITRKVITDNNLTINEYSDNCSQKHIFDVYERELYINETQLEHLYKFTSKNTDAIYVYFPIEFDIADDGTRSLDKEFQKEIDEIIHNILEDLKLRYEIKYITVSGSIEERVKQIEKLLN